MNCSLLFLLTGTKTHFSTAILTSVGLGCYSSPTLLETEGYPVFMPIWPWLYHFRDLCTHAHMLSRISRPHTHHFSRRYAVGKGCGYVKLIENSSSSEIGTLDQLKTHENITEAQHQQLEFAVSKKFSGYRSLWIDSSMQVAFLWS